MQELNTLLGTISRPSLAFTINGYSYVSFHVIAISLYKTGGIFVIYDRNAEPNKFLNLFGYLRHQNGQNV